MNLPDSEFYARLRAYVRKRVPSSCDADDVVQTVMVRLLERRGSKTLSSTKAWLLAATRTAVVDLHRDRARSGKPISDGTDLQRAAAEEGSDITECLLPLLATLDPEDRAILQRVEIEGESQARLAHEMSLSVSGLKSRVQRARARLRELVLSRCIVDRNQHGMPVGPATCRPDRGSAPCGCN
jgi:RNA polymerase sigma-70 factor (ECF subfamily)